MVSGTQGISFFIKKKNILHRKFLRSYKWLTTHGLLMNYYNNMYDITNRGLCLYLVYVWETFCYSFNYCN